MPWSRRYCDSGWSLIGNSTICTETQIFQLIRHKTLIRLHGDVSISTPGPAVRNKTRTHRSETTFLTELRTPAAKICSLGPDLDGLGVPPGEREVFGPGFKVFCRICGEQARKSAIQHFYKGLTPVASNILSFLIEVADD